MSEQLVLSLFPGIGLLDMAFEEEGFCVVRGPDLLWGGDVRRFHPPAGKFDGVIGGPPCQAFSRLVHIVRANGHKVAENLVPEFARCVAEARPRWFLMENVPGAPAPDVPRYVMQDTLLNNRWLGEEQNRLRKFWFGVRGADDAVVWRIQEAALECSSESRAVVRDSREVPVKLLKGGRPKGGGRMPHVGRTMSISRMAELQGLPADFLSGEDVPLTASGKRHVIGNGVPLPMGRAVAKAVKRALGLP